MSRYRPPQPRSSPYITRAGYERLQTEAAELWVRRADVTAAVSAAAAEGDRSENAEYIYRKKELRELDRRIRYLQKRMPDLTAVEPRQDQPAADAPVFFGAEVALEDEAGQLRTVTLVGADEIDPAVGKISIDSPLGKALLKRRRDDEVSILVKERQQTYTVIAVSYPH